MATKKRASKKSAAKKSGAAKKPGTLSTVKKPDPLSSVKRPGKRPVAAAAKKASKKAAGAKSIVAWEDDPGAPGSVPPLTPVGSPAPKLAATLLSISISETAPPAKAHTPGTPEFRYWTAAEALRRSADFWGAIIPAGTRWAVGATLPVRLDAGRDLNAFYTRGGFGDPPGLSFFHDNVGGRVIFSGESPDIVCHELGHALLDAVKPQLFNVMSVEVSSFHEAFGDISAILSALQLKSVRNAAIAETAGRLNRSSRLSRLAEQLGWAIRQINPDAVDASCLRNAVNSFFYRNPKDLPPDNPATLLSSEPHSFSRVFTGGFFEALAGMFKVSAASPTEQDLLKVSRDAGRLLIAAVISAPIAPNYYSQIAAHMIFADAAAPFNRKYRDALKGAFVRRGILSLEAAASLTGAASDAGRSRRASLTGGVGAAGGGETLPQVPLNAGKYGLNSGGFLCEAPSEAVGMQVHAAAPDVGEIRPPSAPEAAESFAEDLFRRGRVRIDEAHTDPETRITQPLIRKKTHEVVEVSGQLQIERRTFDCGFD